MALFDWFKKKAAPTPAAAPTEKISLTGEGEIVEYAPGDGVGSIRLGEGTALRFGRSACRGFEPIVGTRVVVRESVPAPFGGGVRASQIELAPGANYDALVAPRASDSPGSCAHLGTVTVLLTEPVPDKPVALRAWLEPLGLQALGVRVDVQPELVFHVAGRTGNTFMGHQPYPREGLDLVEVPADFDPGRAWLCVSLGLPTMGRTLRQVAAPPHPFGPQGDMRVLSRLVVALLRRGTGVVLNRAGETVTDREQFIRLLGNLDDETCMPWSAWVTVAVASERDCYQSFGMSVFGLPEVWVPFERGDAWAASRASEAVSWTCARMVRDNRELQEGEPWEVPLRVRAGAWPASSEGAVESYEVRAPATGPIVLHRRSSPHPGLAWRAQPAQVPLNAYQALLDVALAEQLPGGTVGEYPNLRGDPPHTLLIRQLEGVFAVATSGFGRRLQKGGEQGVAPRIELGTFLPVPDFDTAVLVGQLGSYFFSSESPGEALKPGDSVRASFPERGIAGFLLVPAATFPMHEGPEVMLLALVPLSDTEYADVRSAGSLPLRRVLGEGAALRAAIARRWRIPQA